MTISKLSTKQKELLKWCHKPSTKNKYDAIICDGAVRSGKTIVMTISFIFWAMRNFNGANFGICGKTVRSAERNIIQPLQQSADITHYFKVKYTRSINVLEVSSGTQTNYFYVFSGKDEASYMLVQGITLSGVMFDEVALMPQSFVDQAIARTLSVPLAKLWFNCNPESPNHWFYLDWIKDADGENKHRSLHLHFLMEDNPTLSEEQLVKAKAMFSGVFYQRYIQGEWVVAEGLIYPMFNKEYHVVPSISRPYERYYISCDYGTVNPMSMGLWGRADGIWYRIKEYYHNGRETKQQKTDEEYYTALERLASDRLIVSVIVDPSAASFIECIKRHGKFRVQKAQNDVLNGIQNVATHLKIGDMRFCECCKDCITEFGIYLWDSKSSEDKPIKEKDHAMDDVRYFVNTVIDNKNLIKMHNFKI